jgi:hypothetical protein
MAMGLANWTVGALEDMVYYPVYVYEAATTLVTYSRVHDRAGQPRK